MNGKELDEEKTRILILKETNNEILDLYKNIKLNLLSIITSEWFRTVQWTLCSIFHHYFLQMSPKQVKKLNT